MAGEITEFPIQTATANDSLSSSDSLWLYNQIVKPYIPITTIGAGITDNYDFTGGYTGSVDLGSGQSYLISSDQTLYIRLSDEPGAEGADFTASTDFLTNNLTAVGTEFDFGTGNLSYEFWGSIRDYMASPASTSAGRNGTHSRMVTEYAVQSRANISMDCGVYTTTGTNIIPTSVIVDTGLLPSDDIHHFVTMVTRDGVSSKVEYYVDGIKYGEASFNDAAPSESVNLSASASTRIVIGGNAGGVPFWDGKLYACRWYSEALTQEQISHRNKLGPNNLPTDGLLPSFYCDLNTRSSWSDQNIPEIFDGAGSSILDLDASVGYDPVTYPGGYPSTINDFRLVSDNYLTISNTSPQYLQYYAPPDLSGTLKVTEAE